jgi:hypothetical protein
MVVPPAALPEAVPPPEGPVQAVIAKADTPASAITLCRAFRFIIICELSVRRLLARGPKVERFDFVGHTLY